MPSQHQTVTTGRGPIIETYGKYVRRTILHRAERDGPVIDEKQRQKQAVVRQANPAPRIPPRLWGTTAAARDDEGRSRASSAKNSRSQLPVRPCLSPIHRPSRINIEARARCRSDAF